MAIRKTLTVTANGEEVLVKELTVKEIIAFMDTSKAGADPEADTSATMVQEILSQVDALLSISVPGLKMEKLFEWAPSEIQKLYDAFKEVNAVFFEIARRLGLNSLIGEVEQAIATDFSASFANSLKRGTPVP